MKTIKNVTVIGAGVMGRQIALNAAVHGFIVHLADTFPEACEKAAKWAEEYLAKSVAKGKSTQEDADNALNRMHYSENPSEAVANCDLLIESIIEDEAIKHELFKSISAALPEDTIVTTNSSFIPSSSFAKDIGSPSRLCNLHYFNPAMLMKLVEIVKGEHTAAETVQALVAFVKAIEKESIVVNKEVDGFVVNRLIKALQNEAFFLFENGIASIEDIDIGAEKGLNFPLGPFRLLDLAGIDICYLNRQRIYEQTGRPEDKPPAFIEEKYKKGEFGRKTGKGWYDYSIK